MGDQICLLNSLLRLYEVLQEQNKHINFLTNSRVPRIGLILTSVPEVCRLASLHRVHCLCVSYTPCTLLYSFASYFLPSHFSLMPVTLFSRYCVVPPLLMYQ